MVRDAASSRTLASASACRSSLPPRKRICIHSKPSSSRKTLTLAAPNLSNCHACGSATKGKLQTISSQWRVVLLCPNCLSGIDSSDICSYCFSKVSISAADGLDCSACNHRVHRNCLTFSPPPDSFTCVDCWVPKCFAADSSGRDRTSCSFPGRAAKEPPRRCPLLKDANQSVERAVAAAKRARERAASKAASAKRAAERARSALDMALLAARKDGCLDGNSALGDKELAVRLHRLMNSSPRLSKVLGVADLDSVDALKRQKNFKGPNLDSYSISGKLQACTNGKENPSATDVEPSVGFSVFDRNSSVDLDATTTICTEVNGEMISSGDECRDGVVEGFRTEREVGSAENLNCDDEKSDMPMKEEQGSCSNKVVNSSEDDDNSAESGGSESCEKQLLKDMDSSKCSGTQCLAVDDGISSNVLQRRCDLITYSKRRVRS